MWGDSDAPRRNSIELLMQPIYTELTANHIDMMKQDKECIKLLKTWKDKRDLCQLVTDILILI